MTPSSVCSLLACKCPIAGLPLGDLTNDHNNLLNRICDKPEAMDDARLHPDGDDAVIQGGLRDAVVQDGLGEE